ncbi:hypothetical protein RND71_043029 [Anisodus tanguticus]|uniref:Reticulon-like protein n=1 Tax=Anisodus tanguticus TaxID=243964 RepID=A0AAE1UPR5_9SOLA|nr:hypothetical protein RND71_043029 [Anisodus tanguticus]
MEVASKRKGKISRNGVVVAGSVWENRMRFDDVKGGINVYSEKKETPQVENDEKISTIISGEKTNQVQVYKKLDMGSKCNNLGVGGIVMNGKRKTWKSESNLEGNSNQIVKKTSELSNFCVDNAMKKSPMNKNKKCSSSVRNQLRKVKSEANKEGNEKNCELRKVKSVSLDGNLRNSLHLSVRRTKLLLCAGSEEGSDHESLSASSKELEEEKCKNFEENKVVVDADVLDDESKKNLEENEDGNERNIGLKKVKSMHLSGDLRDSLQIVKEKSEKCKENFEENKVVVDESKRDLEGSIEENCKEFGVCEEKVITTSNVKSPLKQELNLENEEEDQENIDEEIEKESVVDVKEINVEEQIIKPKKIVIVENNKVHISNNIKKTVPITPIIKKRSLPISGQSRIHHHHHHHHPSPTRTKPVPTSDEFQTNIPRQHSNLQSLVDLIMWRDASKSALIFGIGTFVIISSSYTKDLNISFISVISYLGLVYLAAIFLFRSLRGANDIGESSEYVLGEEEAVWVLKLILPYINECLLKIRALFSGDPATTMKMAVLLFILARCGSSITIWKMSKLGFFGVFTVPKVCSSYSTQLTACGTFWIRRFRDAWVSCTHKKAVAFAIFTLIWNLSSFFARIWAVFMLYVGFRYYQQKLIKEG